MSLKNNKQLQIDREAIAQFQVYTAAALQDIENQFDAVKRSCTFLLDDANVSGGDSVEFKASIQAIQEAVTTVGQKFDAVEKSVRRINEIAGNNASANKVLLADARRDMGAQLVKLKEAGR